LFERPDLKKNGGTGRRFKKTQGEKGGTRPRDAGGGKKGGRESKGDQHAKPAERGEGAVGVPSAGMGFTFGYYPVEWGKWAAEGSRKKGWKTLGMRGKKKNLFIGGADVWSGYHRARRDQRPSLFQTKRRKKEREEPGPNRKRLRTYNSLGRKRGPGEVGKRPWDCIRLDEIRTKKSAGSQSGGLTLSLTSTALLHMRKNSAKRRGPTRRDESVVAVVGRGRDGGEGGNWEGKTKRNTRILEGRTEWGKAKGGRPRSRDVQNKR